MPSLSTAAAALAPVLERFGSEVTRQAWTPGASEGTLYPAVQDLIEGAARALGAGDVEARLLPIGDDVGDCRPDFQVLRGQGEVIGYVEVKRANRQKLPEVEKSRQLLRYLDAFPNLLLTNLTELRLWQGGQLAGTASARDPEAAWPLFARFLPFRSSRHRTPRALAIDLAHRTRFLRREIELLLDGDPSREPVRRLHALFEASRHYLIEGQSKEEFAALYAETLTYGLVAARAWSPDPEGRFDVLEAFERIPKSLGILRHLFRYITADEPAEEIRWIVADLVEVLRAADMRRVLEPRNGGRAAGDPIYHFYETFLREYDPETRRRRGVYYTPQAVVSYIVRSAEAILRKDFGKRDGFADEGVTVLDPAAGTLAFLAEAARAAIRAWRFSDETGVPALIRDRLLPGLCGFELLMAPYVIGHLRLARLYERHHHRLSGNERVRLYLADALRGKEPAQPELPLIQLFADEAHEAWRIEHEQPITVVLGNPPYRGHSANRRREKEPGSKAPPWIERLLKEGYPAADGRRDHGYYRAGGRPLDERNPKWLQNDYVKFLRLAQWIVDRQGSGVVGFITDRGWLENPTFRGMRESLLGTFDSLYLLDLHGELRQTIRTGDHPGDENVFPEIQQGVAVALLVKRPRESGDVPGAPGLEASPETEPEPRAPWVLRHELVGTREKKFHWLDSNDVRSTPWRELHPEPPGWFLDATGSASSRYRGYPALDEIFPVSSVGMVTARDEFVTDRRERELKRRIDAFRGCTPKGAEDAGTWKTRNTRTWRIETAWTRLKSDLGWSSRIQPYLYRPFQTRHVFYADYMVERPRREVMRHLLRPENLGLVAPKQAKEEPGALVANQIVGHKAFSAYDINYVFPLYFEGGPLDDSLRPNLEPALLADLHRRYGATTKPMQILAYVYAVLYSRGYRRRHGEALRTGFPRIPFTEDPDLFFRLSEIGQRLIDLHLLDPAATDLSPARYEGGARGGDDEDVPPPGKRAITTRRYDPARRRVVVNDHGDAFSGVSPEAWAYRIGGYQVLDRWLADAAKDVPSADDIQCFCRTVAALERTLELEPEIDRLVAAVEEEAGEEAGAGRAVAAL